ncbi:MAG: hypothetical protein NTZ42_02515, partial [Candidatus Gribaldobacteria bacterium]|nr:hypothetical protein [Candidatus Gribaldobacteria bacterium]
GAKAESLIAIYSAYFKGGYEQLQNEVNKTIDYFKGINFESTLEKIAADLRAKDLDIGLNDHDIAKISELKKQFEKELDKKRDLNYVIDFATFDDLKTGIEKIKANLEELEQKKLNIPSPKSVIDLEKEKQMLEIIKKRHTPAWIKFCKDLDAIETEAQKIRATREIKRGELDTYSSDIFNTHKVAINKFCA